MLKVDIKKRLGDFTLEVRLDAGFAPIALLGASGSGKSVTLKCIAGIMTPDEGQIALDGQMLFDSDKHINLPPQKRKIGYLFQNYALFPHMTVRQNIASAVTDRKNRDRTVETMLRRFRLEDAAEKRPHQLSGGQQQRTALGRILASGAHAILLDEPLSALDGYLRSQLELELSDELRAFQGPVIWVSHDRGEVYRNCRYVTVLEEGVSQAATDVESLFSRPATEGAARLSGCENCVDAMLRGNAIFLPQWGVTLQCGYLMAPSLNRIGIRANHVRLAGPETVNAFDADVTRVVEDIDSTLLLLRPVGAPEESPLLRMRLEKGTWNTISSRERLTVSVSPQDILLLR